MQTREDGVLDPTDDVEAGRTMLFFSGPIKGSVTLDDGTVYDVNEDWTALRPEHFDEVDAKTTELYRQAGRIPALTE